MRDMCVGGSGPATGQSVYGRLLGILVNTHANVFAKPVFWLLLIFQWIFSWSFPLQNCPFQYQKKLTEETWIFTEKLTEKSTG